MSDTDSSRRKAIIGNAKSFWIYDSETGYDLTHPATPTSPAIHNALRLKTAALPIAVDPAKSALVIIDMQNFFLSPSLGRSPTSKGIQAQDAVLKYAIPAARKVGMRTIWVNWGLTQEEVDEMPPATHRAFGSRSVESSQFDAFANILQKQAATGGYGVNAAASQLAANGIDTKLDRTGKSTRVYTGLGSDMGSVELADGTTVDAGKLLMRDQWNTALTPELTRAYDEGQKASPPDIWIHKNRMSALWGESTALSKFLDQNGIKTLFFAGVNTDQCVGGTLTDAFSKGYDCILLSDGAATSSPNHSQECYEFNAAGTYGFCTSCKEMWDGANA